MRKSKAEAAETRKRILAAASGEFLRHGIGATAIADVMVAAGMTQGGFYRHFESKEHLVAEASAAAFEAIFAGFDAAATGKSPREAIELIVHLYLHQLDASEQGALCPLVNLGSELRHSDEQVKGVVLDGYSRFVKLFAACLMRLDYTDYVGLAESIVSVIVGAVSIAGLAPDRKIADTILTNAENTVKMLLQSAPVSAALVTQRA
ncbi:TetR/AcrR family transcriptional regulator [Duganella callida]|uniref:TetR family transcriptional regulator n=1 Tax=Duganella callida TaxID=2561932 RepID=A0A4Y9SVA4_9BURK|nr:TetR family transcriptional regulator [Duganella callida]TFW29269.1 TetR family transcriptional regulator [Duganella callida]